MSQIFLWLSLASNLSLAVTYALGWRIDDARALTDAARQQVSLHFLFALASVMLALLVHAIVLTYFMGTGRWIEETSAAYGFTADARSANIQLKYKVLPGMMLCLLLLLSTGALGAIADPASNASLPGAATIHFLLATSAILVNVIVSFWERKQIQNNAQLVDAVYQEVLQVRREHGLDAPTEPNNAGSSPPASPS